LHIVLITNTYYNRFSLRGGDRPSWQDLDRRRHATPITISPSSAYVAHMTRAMNAFDSVHIKGY
jgi:hypothetical protein